MQRGDHTGEVELLAQLAEHRADAEPADQQGVSERGGIGEPIPPKLAGGRGVAVHTLFCTSKEDPLVAPIAGNVCARRV